MKVLFVGDICGRPGRQAAQTLIPELRRELDLDFVIANGENAAGGVGLTPDILQEFLQQGVDVVTSGNHIWDKRDIFKCIDAEPRLLRPANYPSGTPGRGWGVFETPFARIAVVNLAGRVYMPPVDCPFRAADEILRQIGSKADLIVVEMHAEATSEKKALGYYLDGRVACVVGTHTHVQTADEQALPKGTVYLSDLGMTGADDSILGMDKDIVLQKFLTGLPVRFEVASGAASLCGFYVEFDLRRKCVREFRRIQEAL